MVKFFARLFIKNYQDTTDQNVRASYGRMGGLFGIITNLLLCSFKIVSGILINSIAVIAEGINNLSDAGSSIITLIGFKLSSAPADKEHPYGHERIEYLAGFLVSLAILVIGVNLGISSVQKIIKPEVVLFSTYVLIILAVSILVKFIQFFFYRQIGRIINSQTIVATASDSLNDTITTTAVLLAIIISRIFDVNLDGYIGLLVSVFIVFSGVKLVKSTMNPLIGIAPEDGFVEMMMEKILSYEGVLGMHDLVVHSYGPNKTFVTAHVEVASDVNVNISHDIIDNIEHDFRHELNVELVIHMDPIDTKDLMTLDLKDKVKIILETIDPNISFHDFRVVKGITHINLIFDVVIPPKFEMTPDEVDKLITKKIKAYDKRFNAVITVDQSYGLNLSREN